jgi:Zn-dependent peptidase ImmA (M78 family)
MSAKPNRVIAAAEADGLWSLYGLKSPSELILEDIAMAQGIVVMDGPLDSALARLVRSGDTGIVRINERIKLPGQRRFAIAHEIGHWRLHEKVAHLLACTDEDMLPSAQGNILEAEASIFASALLMPEFLFTKRVGGRLPTTSTIKDLADFFGTSITAAAVRYVETATDYCVFVLSENNRIRWWRASNSFGDHELWMDNRTILPRASPAANFFRGEEVPATPQHVDLNLWLGDLPNIYSDTVIEQAIPLSSYKQVISLLWLP